jgi:hypothetical protein
LPASVFLPAADFGSIGHCPTLCLDVLECAIAGLWYRCIACRESSEGPGTGAGMRTDSQIRSILQDPDRFL